MDLLKPIVKHIITPLSRLLHSTPTLLLLSYFLQSLFFTLSITSLLQTLLLLINFPYTNYILNNSLTKSLLTILFYSAKIWEYEQSMFFNSFAYLSATFVSLYVYDNCIRWADRYVGRVRGYYFWQVVGYVGLGMLLPVGVMGWWGDGLGVVGALMGITAGLVAVVNGIKNKHIVYTAFISIMYFSVPFLRMLNKTSKYTLDLPLQMFPLLICAFNGQYNQQKQSSSSSSASSQKRSKIIFSILKSSSFFLLYYSMSGNIVYIQLVIGFVALFVQLFKWNQK